MASIILTSASLLITFLFALANFKFARQTLRLNQHNMEVSDKLILRNQASLIAVWNGPIDVNRYVSVTLSNQSKLPIYNVLLVDINTKHNDGFESVKRVIQYSEKNYNFYRVIPPGIHTVRVHGLGPDIGGGLDMVDILFTDSNNHKWFRKINGELEQIDYLKELIKVGFCKPYSYDTFEGEK